MNEYLVDCRKGLHDLIEIYRRGSIYEDEVVRWCRICGAIVVDLEIDNRIYPGNILNMMTPLIIGKIS